LRALVSDGVSLAEAAAPVPLYPQVLINVGVKQRFDFAAQQAVQRAVADAERDLDDSGRVLLRASGTEPVIRVMVEGKARAKVKRWAETIAQAVREAS
jgi:phosphoglucosamine mutase